MAKILITGVNGHIGSSLAVALLRKGHTIFGLDIQSNNISFLSIHKTFHFIEADLTRNNINSPKLLDTEILIHCAALTHKSSKDLSRSNYFMVNYEGTKNLLSSLGKSRLKHIIFLSSVSVYGNRDPKSIVDENTPVHPNDFYGESKVAAEKEILDFSRRHSIPYTIFRLPPVYGKRFLLNIRKRVYLPHALAFYKIGSGRQRLSLCSIPNIIETMAVIIKNEKHFNEIYILKDAEDYSVNEMIRILKEVFSQRLKPVVCIPYWIPHLCFSVLALLVPQKGNLFKYQIRKIEKDSLNIAKKIFNAGVKMKWDLQRTLTQNLHEMD
jgi:nucleoside-diphosphate-sugar epimerase